MFFYLSKIAWMIFRPLNLMALLALAAYFAKRKNRPQLAAKLYMFSASLFLVFGLTQLPDLLIGALEKQYPEYDVRKKPEAPFGIIILGGGLSASGYDAGLAWQTGSSAERFLEGLALKKRYPSARVIYTGGNNSLIGGGKPETDAARQLALDLYGKDPGIIYETKSRTTAENAFFTEQLAGEDKQKGWILVTSAWHMPRAMAVFKKAGFNVTAYPTDYEADKLRFPWLTANASGQFMKAETAMKELAGIVGYWIAGKL